MIKSRHGNKGTCRGLQLYLEKKGRALAIDYSPQVGDRARWGSDMDACRKAAGKDDGRKYYHFILSPDPKDHATLDEVRGLATAWAEDNYPGSQWAVVYHDDNARHITHAHVVLNAYDPSTGAKVHRSDRRLQREADSWNALLGKAGLSRLPKIEVGKAKGTKQATKLTQAEKGIRNGGQLPWKDRLRAAIEEAAPKASDIIAFQSALRAMGIGSYTNKRGQLVYVPPDAWHGFPCKDRSLGDGYCKERLMAAFTPDLGAEARAFSARVPARAAMPGLFVPAYKRTSYADLLEGRGPRRGVGAQRLARAIGTVRSQGVRSLSDLDRRLQEARESVDAARASLDVLEGRQAAARQALDRIATLRRFSHVWEQYEGAPGARGRARIKGQYPEAVDACNEAYDFLADRGLYDEASYRGIERAYLEGMSKAGILRQGLEGAESALRALEDARRTVVLVNRQAGLGKAAPAGKGLATKASPGAAAPGRPFTAPPGLLAADRAGDASAQRRQRLRLAADTSRKDRERRAREAASGIGRAREPGAAPKGKER